VGDVYNFLLRKYVGMGIYSQNKKLSLTRLRDVINYGIITQQLGGQQVVIRPVFTDNVGNTAYIKKTLLTLFHTFVGKTKNADLQINPLYGAHYSKEKKEDTILANRLLSTHIVANKRGKFGITTDSSKIMSLTTNTLKTANNGISNLESFRRLFSSNVNKGDFINVQNLQAEVNTPESDANTLVKGYINNLGLYLLFRNYRNYFDLTHKTKKQ